MRAIYLLFLVVGTSQVIVLGYKVPAFFTAVSVIVIGSLIGFYCFMLTKYLRRKIMEVVVNCEQCPRKKLLNIVKEDESLLAFARTVMTEN